MFEVARELCVLLTAHPYTGIQLHASGSVVALGSFTCERNGTGFEVWKNEGGFSIWKFATASEAAKFLYGRYFI